MIISFHIFIISFKMTRETIWNTKRYPTSLTQDGKLPMLCPRHGLTLAYMSRPMPCPRHGLTLARISMLMPCPRHGLTLALILWPMPWPRHGLTLVHISTSKPCPKHGLTLDLIPLSTPCSRHGLTLAHISLKCHGMDIQSIPRFNREFTTFKFYHALFKSILNHIMQIQSFNIYGTVVSRPQI
ncbi:Homogentisate 1,2-dioxygenase [Gossypium arboreum]|uniref:Homogentisate 1,2-dioxygenase n=1 Tax=Gossypium arboreum TaxID=29729 RepID=A0A0B0MFE6_GOSAR|nr:Homogentisate 1,2-dioxygenase [Gossypium arboreum]